MAYCTAIKIWETFHHQHEQLLEVKRRREREMGLKTSNIDEYLLQPKMNKTIMRKPKKKQIENSASVAIITGIEIIPEKSTLEEDKLSYKKEKPKASKDYMKIIANQEMFGNWNWEKTVFDALDVDEAKAHSCIPAKLKEMLSDGKDLLAVWVTILAMAKLEMCCADSESSWQLLFKKAAQWLKKYCVSYQEFETLTKKIIEC
eukprot:TRINITY_DN12620_c0_g1_i7.p1 TRINITY_DN12620_c0_g1~~TRINITY_DN12620_c0_g1_i7.p1  ORF type:complete len:203 (+),score=26.14 TRINITY_DN12620_c0_g1_i7:122-730(+)